MFPNLKVEGLALMNGDEFLQLRTCLQLGIVQASSKSLGSPFFLLWHRWLRGKENILWSCSTRWGSINNVGWGKALSANNNNNNIPVTGEQPFVYKHMGSMASVGRYKALVDLRQSKGEKGVSLAGWFIWRSAYLSRVVSWRNRFYVAVNWATTLVFGRDNSRIG